MLEKLGLNASDWGGLLLAILGAITLILGTVATWIIRTNIAPDPVVKTYQKFCAKLARIGIHRQPNEGPIDFSRRVGKQVPAIAQTVEAVTTSYVELRYAQSSDNYKSFAKAVSSFRTS